MRQDMLSGFICIILMLTLLPSPMANIEHGLDYECILIDPEFILDQKQQKNSYEFSLHYNIQIAQSFKPSMTPLTKVDIRLNKPSVIEMPIEVSIRKKLDGSDLTSLLIPAEQIPYYIFWVEFDFPDIEVNLDEIYYIVVRTSTSSEKCYQWLYEYNETDDPYDRGKQWMSFDHGNTWNPTETEDCYMDATFRTYSYISKPDLECNGAFNWTEVKPGENVTGSFTVANIGTPLSYINWKIQIWPSWGTWSFEPFNGTGLKPEDGYTTVNVFVEAPHSSLPDEYFGEIRIINEDNPEDYCTISTRLVTPKSKNSIDSQSFQFLKEIIQNFPFLQWLLKFCPSINVTS